MRDDRVMGDILEIDYQKHLDYLCTHSHDPAKVEVVFKNPNSCRTFGWQEYEQNDYHKVMFSEYQPELTDSDCNGKQYKNLIARYITG